MLLLGVGRACVAQHTAPATAYAAGASFQTASDSVRQAVHKLFKFGRFISTVGGISGALVLGSSIRYAAKGDADWRTGLDLALVLAASRSAFKVWCASAAAANGRY